MQTFQTFKAHIPLQKYFSENTQKFRKEMEEYLENGHTVLHEAFLNKDWEACRAWLPQYVNYQDAFGRTCLHYATSREQVSWLMEMNSADPEIIDENGYTPLVYIAMHGHEEAVGSLLEFEACNPVHNDSCGLTPSENARVMGYDKIADLIDEVVKKFFEK